MINTDRIFRRFGDDICRRCINEEYKVDLTPDDCVYGYTYTCRRCGEMHNIVIAFTLSGKKKMFFKH